MSFINPPEKIPWYLRLGIFIAEKTTKKRMEPARLLAWYPKAAMSSGILETLVAHSEPGLPERLLKLIRMQTSFRASCPFCIDMNAFEFEKHQISPDEIKALQGELEIDAVSSFTDKEKIALKYTCEVTETPVSIQGSTVSALKTLFNEKQIVIISTTIAQVNYWARLIQSLGIHPAGYLEHCEIIDLEKYKTIRE